MANDWRLTVDAVLELQESAEMDTSPAPSLQWFPQQWLGDPAVQLMGWTARGIHHHLLMVAWKGFDLDGDAVPCSLPGDASLIAGICQQPPEWDTIWGSISRAWKHYRGRWWNLGLCRSYLSQMDKRRVRKGAADARWAKRDSKADANASKRDANASADDACAEIVQCSSSSSSIPSSASPPNTEKDTAEAADSRVLDDCGIEIAEEADKTARTREKRARVAYLSQRIPGLDDAAKADGCADWWSWRMATVGSAKKPNAWRQLCQLRKLCKWSLQHGPADVLRLVGMAQKNGWGGIEWSYLSGNGSGQRRAEVPAGESPAQAAARMRAAYMKGREA